MLSHRHAETHTHTHTLSHLAPAGNTINMLPRCMRGGAETLDRGRSAQSYGSEGELINNRLKGKKEKSWPTILIKLFLFRPLQRTAVSNSSPFRFPNVNVLVICFFLTVPRSEASRSADNRKQDNLCLLRTLP